MSRPSCPPPSQSMTTHNCSCVSLQRGSDKEGFLTRTPTNVAKHGCTNISSRFKVTGRGCGNTWLQTDTQGVGKYLDGEGVPHLIDLSLVLVDALRLVGVGLHQALRVAVEVAYLDTAA